MARLYEYQAKALLKDFDIPVPVGKPASTPEEAGRIAAEIGKAVMVKAQTWVTGRAGLGAIKRADTPAEAEAAARQILRMRVRNSPVEVVLVEELLDIGREFYMGFIINDRAQSLVAMFSSVGGTGIEEIAARHPDKVARQHVDIELGLLPHQARNLVRRTGIHGRLQRDLGTILVNLYRLTRTCEARAAEINPLVLTDNGKLYAVDCRLTIDDYAVFRHPELGISFARDMDRRPTELEQIAYRVEESDYRGTFYFIQLAEGFKKGAGYIGFHGFGGGGSMMAMDVLMRAGFKPANFVDTSGNPPASKVYRAARIVLSQLGLDGYFSSGAGAASQELFHTARGLVKAFLEEQLDIPAVIRLGGNAEDKAVEILERINGHIPALVEGYKKDDSPSFCVERLSELIAGGEHREFTPPPPRPEPKEPNTFETLTGQVSFDHAVCRTCESKVCVKECASQILRLEQGVPMLAVSREEARRRCMECLACEVDCYFLGAGGGRVDLPIPGLDEYRPGSEVTSPLHGGKAYVHPHR
jgi:succinyl-CoA synthetase beta subunit